MLDFRRCSRHTAGYNRFRVLIAPLKPLLKSFSVRRQDENAHHIARKPLSQLSCSLPIDIEKHIRSEAQRFHHGSFGCAITVVKNLRPLEQFSLPSKALEILVVDKKVI